MAKRILVVDDDPDFSELLQFRLRSLNYDVRTVASGTEALYLAWSFLPDLILLDLVLPDLDGLTVCEIFRREFNASQTPVFLITATTTEAIQAAAHIAGASGFFAKPLDFEQLKAQIEAAFTPQAVGVSLVGRPRV